MKGLNFVEMAPANHFVKHAPGFLYQGLACEGNEYAYYFEGEGEINVTLHVPAGDYKVEWINPANGEVISSKHVKSKKELLDLNGPEVKEDVVLKIGVK